MYVFFNSVANIAYRCGPPWEWSSAYFHESIWMVPGTVDPLED